MALEARLKKLKCPHTWGFPNFPDVFLDRYMKSGNGVDHSPEDEGFNHLRLKSNILVAFEKYRREAYRDAIEHIETALNLRYDSFMLKYEKCFLHVVKASKAFCLDKLKLKAKALKICDELDQESYSVADEACFCYLQSSLSMRYGKAGSKECEGLIQKAIELVKDEPTFHNHYGLVLSRVCHFSYPSPCPTKKEIFHLQKAWSLESECPWYAIDLASSILEWNNKSDSSCFTESPAHLLRKALEHSQGLTANILAKCIHCLMKLVPLNELYELETYAAIAKLKGNSTKVNHYIGLFYLKISQFDRALACLQIASFEVAYLSGLVLLLTYRFNNQIIENGTLATMIEDYQQRFEHKEDRKTVLLSICEFFLLVLGDLKNAAVYFKEFLSTSNLRYKYLLRLTKRFKSVGLVQLMVKTLTQYKGNDPEINSLKDYVTQLLKDQNFYVSSVPPLGCLKRSIY